MTDQLDELLTEADMADDVAVRELLTLIRQDATAVRPLPSAELAGLLIPARRRSPIHRHRGALTAIIVIGSLGAGASAAAAASPALRSGAEHVIQVIAATIVPPASHANHAGNNATPGHGSNPAPHPARSHPGGQPDPTVTPAAPIVPSPTDHPGNSDHSGKKDHPGNGSKDKPATPTEHGHSGKSGNSGHGKGSSKPGNPHKPAKPAKPGNPHKP